MPQSELPPAGGTLLEFPCAFPIKVMGPADPALAQAVLEVVLRHAPDFAAATMEMRTSSGGKYLSLTCTINEIGRASCRERV